MLSPHPPQIHSFLRSLGLLDSEHPQEANWPSRQPRDILCTTPAEATALAKAASCKRAKAKNLSNWIQIFCMKDGTKDRRVLQRRAVPLVVPELELALGDAITDALAQVHQIVSVEHAEFPLPT